MATHGRLCCITGFAQVVGQYRAAVLGTVVIATLASGFASGFAAVVDQFAHNGAAAHMSPATPFALTFGVGSATSPASTGHASPDGCCTWGSWDDAPRAPRGRLSAHVVDRWYDPPATGTALPGVAAPTEVRLSERR
jgi:hypothetical protein